MQRNKQYLKSIRTLRKSIKTISKGIKCTKSLPVNVFRPTNFLLSDSCGSDLCAKTQPKASHEFIKPKVLPKSYSKQELVT